MPGLVMEWKSEVGLAFAHVKGVGLFVAKQDKNRYIPGKPVLWSLTLNGKSVMRRKMLSLEHCKVEAQRKLAEMMGLSEASMEEDK